MDRVEVFRDQAGEWRWRRLNGQNGQVVSTSGEAYKNLEHALKMTAQLNGDLQTDVVS